MKRTHHDNAGVRINRRPAVLGGGITLALAASAAIAPLPALAQEPDAALEEVIVTAQKREEKYLDVPVSVSTLSGELLKVAKVENFADLVNVSPSVTFNQSGDMRGSGVLIRGIGTTAFQTAVEPTVSTVVDGIVLGRTGSFLSDLADIERVEVLRGPQGTLFGKNASAGVINVVTKRPTDEFEASARASFTDDDEQLFEAQLSGPLSDGMRGRVSAYTKEFDGFIDNEYTGDSENGYDNWGVRAKLDLDLGERTNLLLIADYSEQDRDCCSPVVASFGANAFLRYDLRDIGVGEENNEVKLSPRTASDTEAYGLSAEFNVDFDSFVFTSITGYRQWKITTQQDVDNVWYTEPTYGRVLFTKNDASGDGEEQEQLSQEFRFTSTGWDSLQLTAGMFFWDQSIDRYFEREVMLCVAPPPGLPPSTTACGAGVVQFGYFDSTVDSLNMAAFGQASWYFAEDWSLIAGLRYTYDELEFDFVRPTPPIISVGLPPVALSNDTDESDLSGKLGLQYDLGDDAMVYVSYAEGYKAPAFDVIFNMTPAVSEPVPEETSEAWEAGLKAELLDNRVRVALTLFHTEFDNLQAQAYDADTNLFRLTSAGTAVTKGVEFDLTAKPTPNLLLNGGIAYTDAYFDEFEGGPCWSGQTVAEGCVAGVQDLSDEPIPNAPEWKYTIQGRYDIALAGPVDLYLAAGYRWQDSVPSSLNQRPSLDIDSYGIADFTLGVDADDGSWSATAFVKNAFDEFYTNVKFETLFDAQGVSHFVNRDSYRYAGVDFTYRFGAY